MKLCLLLITELHAEVSNDSLAPGSPNHQQVIDRHTYIFMKCWFLTGTGNSAKYSSIFPSPYFKYEEDKQGRGVVLAHL